MDDSQITWEEAVKWLRSQPGREPLVKACFFDDPLVAACDRYLASSEWREVRKISGPPGSVLDVGAGRGIASYAYARDGWKTAALEPDSSNLVGAGAIRKINEETGLNIEVVETWGEQLPFPAATFDVVFARQVLHHAADLGAFCREVFRVLRPGGRFIAIREHVLTKESDLSAFLASHPLHELYGGEHAYRLEVYLNRMTEAGFTIEQIFNPYASEINTFPTTLTEIKEQMARKLNWPWPSLIPNCILKLRGAVMNTPGRIYSFVASKPPELLR